MIFFYILKFGYSEKATQFEKMFHLKFDITEFCDLLTISELYPKIWEPQNSK